MTKILIWIVIIEAVIGIIAIIWGIKKSRMRYKNGKI